MTGTTALHAELESQLAEFTGAPAALVFSSGYLANLTVITALAAGARAAGGRARSCPTPATTPRSSTRAAWPARGRDAGGGDPAPRRRARSRRALAGRDEPAAIVVSDAVFSVDGALAPVAGAARGRP